MRLLRRLLVAAVLVTALAVAWVGVRGYLAVGHLEDAAARVPHLQEQLLAGDVSAAQETARSFTDDTARARDLTSDPVWRVVAAFPWGGQNLRAVATGASVAGDLAEDGLPPALAAATAVAELQQGLGSGDLEDSAGAAGSLTQALAAVAGARDAARADLGSVDRRYLVQPVRDALAELEASIELTGQVGALQQ